MMEVLDEREAHLANYEVLQFLREEKETDQKRFAAKSNKHAPQPIRNLATVRLETISALEVTPAKDQDDEVAANFLEEINKFEVRIMIASPWERNA